MWLVPVNTQEPESTILRKERNEQQDTTKIDSIFIQQKTLELEFDNNLLKIKEQNALLDSLLNGDT